MAIQPFLNRASHPDIVEQESTSIQNLALTFSFMHFNTDVKWRA